MIQKQASAFERLLLRNCTLIASLTPIGGIFVSPVINDRISSSVALWQLKSVRCWKNQSYTVPSLSSAGFGVDTNLTGISGVSSQLASYKKTGFIRSEFSCKRLVIFKWSSPRHKALIACWRLRITSFSTSCWRNSDFETVVMDLVGHSEEFPIAIYIGSSMISSREMALIQR